MLKMEPPPVGLEWTRTGLALPSSRQAWTKSTPTEVGSDR
jgi:hypothetical protein